MAKIPLGILDDTLMPVQGHVVVGPEADTQLSEFFRWLTVTHSITAHARDDTRGSGQFYSGRLRAIPVQDGHPLRIVLRYVERNPLRAKLVIRVKH